MTDRIACIRTHARARRRVKFRLRKSFAKRSNESSLNLRSRSIDSEF